MKNGYNAIFYLFVFACAGLVTNDSAGQIRFGKRSSRGPETEEAVDKQAQSIRDLYNTYRRELYDQSGIIDTEDYKNASPEQREQMLEDYFVNTKWWSDNKLVSTSAVKLSVGIAAFYALTRYLGGGARAGDQAAGAAMNNQLMLFMSGLGGLAALKIEEAWHELMGIGERVCKILPYCPRLFGFTEELHNLDALERAYVRIKPHIDPQLQEMIENKFINFYVSGDPKSIKPGSDYLTTIEFVKTAINIPTAIKPIHFDKKLFEEASRKWPESARPELRRFVVRHIAGYPSGLFKMAPYAFGLAGVGKTYGIEEIAKAMQLPFASIKLTENEADIKGTSDKPGALLEALTSAKKDGKGAGNMILLIDEADKTINIAQGSQLGFLLEFFDPGKKKISFKSPYLDNFEVDISNLGIILAGNQPIRPPSAKMRKEEQTGDNPLASRFRSFEWAPPTKDAKQAAVFKPDGFLDKALLPYVKHEEKQQVFTLDKEDLTEQDRKNIEAMVVKDTDPGYRSIQAKVQDYIADLAFCKVTMEGDWHNECFKMMAKEAATAQAEAQALAKEPAGWRSWLSSWVQ